MTPRKHGPTRVPSDTDQPAPRTPAPAPLPTDEHGAHRDAAAEGKRFVYNPTVALPVGTVATRLPRAKAPNVRYDWPAVRALMEAHPGLWVKALEGLSSGMYSYVRRGGPTAFHGMGGHMQVSLRNQHPNPNKDAKGKVGDLWVRWIPEGWTDQDQARAEATVAAGEGVI